MLLEGPLQGRAVAEAAGCLERSLTRCRRVAAPRRPCGRVSKAAVDAVLAGKTRPGRRRRCAAADPAKALAATADDFVRDRLLAPALDAAAANVAVVTKRRPSVFQTDDGGDDGPPPAFYDVVRAARVAATSWRGRLAVLAPGSEASDAAAAAAARALDAAAQRTADGLGEALGRARQSGDYAMRDEPSVLKPTKATVAFRDALLRRAAARGPRLRGARRPAGDVAQVARGARVARRRGASDVRQGHAGALRAGAGPREIRRARRRSARTRPTRGSGG